MKSILNIALSTALTSAFITCSMQGIAGNPERSGQAGASQLLINPYGRSAGQAGANTARAKGLEAQYMNVAGLAFTKKTELMFMRTSWLVGTGININAFGFS